MTSLDIKVIDTSVQHRVRFQLRLYLVMVDMPATEVIMGCWLNLVNNPVHNTHVGPGWSEVHRKTP